MARALAPRLFLLTLVITTWLGHRAASAQAPEWSFEFRHDFRGQPLPAELNWFNAEDGRFFHQEPDGLRIVIPDTWTHAWGGIGFRTAFGCEGDFEITTAFEILHADTPMQGYGVGICLAAWTEGGGVSLCRLTRKMGKQILLWDHSKADAKNPVEGTIPCVDKAGRLRLKRVGTTVHYQWAPGIEGGQFEDIHQREFGNEPISRVRIAGVTGRQPCNLDLRLLELHVRSKNAGEPGGIPVAAAAPSSSRSGWRIWAVGILVVAIVLGTYLAVRRSRPVVRG